MLALIAFCKILINVVVESRLTCCDFIPMLFSSVDEIFLESESRIISHGMIPDRPSLNGSPEDD